MALINCPECGFQVSEFASDCPKCGSPIFKTEPQNNPKPQNNPHEKEHPVSTKNVRKFNKLYLFIFGILFIIIILIGLTLPFHYIPSRSQVFLKGQLTFNYTFITEADIENLVTQFNDASFFEKIAMLNDPIIKKLKEQNIIVDSSSTSSETGDKLPESDKTNDETDQNSFIFCQNSTILFAIESGINNEDQIVAVPFVMYCDGRYQRIPVCELGAAKEKAIEECEEAKKSVLPIVSQGQILYSLINGLQKESLTIKESTQYGFSDWQTYSAVITARPNATILTNNSNIGMKPFKDIESRPILEDRMNPEGVKFSDKLFEKVDIDCDGVQEQIYLCSDYEGHFYQIFSYKKDTWKKVFVGGYQGL